MTNQIVASSRRGFTVLEATLALATFSIAFVMLAQFLTAAVGQRRASEQRRVALQEAANTLERVAALPWDEVTAENLAAWEPSPQLANVLPNGELKLTAAAEPGLPEAKRVRVEVAWPNAAGQIGEPIGLTTFVYRPREAQP